MVSILPSHRSSWDVIGDMIGQNMSQNLPRAIEQASNRKMLQESLAQVKNLASSGGSPLDITLAAMQAGAGIPGSERYMAQILPMIQQFAAARASQNAPLAGEVSATPQMPRERGESIQQAPRTPLPGFIGQQPSQAEMNFPTALGPQGGPGQVPQAATQGQKVPLLTPAERMTAARKLTAERNEAGIPTKLGEALEEIKANEEDKKLYNQEIDKEQEKRIKGQQTYGQRAVDYLKNALGEFPVSDELATRFQKLGEEASKRGDSEADINAYLAAKAKELANQIANVRKSTSAPRVFNSMLRAMNGTYKDMESSAKDVRKHLQPLIDEGLWDTARLLLSDLGYGKEESEAIINPLDVRSMAALNSIPRTSLIHKQKAPGIPSSVFKNQGPDINNIKEGLMNLYESNPNFSLLLARKYVEDKGYNWRNFKDALNALTEEGQIQLSGDQKAQLGFLDTPPLSLLDTILEPFYGR